MYKAFQFRLQPTAAQERQLWQFCGAVRWVYNRMLAERNVTYKATGKSPTAKAQLVQLPILKQQLETAWLSDIHSQVLPNAVLDVEDAFTRFFARQNGYPKFKKKHGRRQSFTYPQGVKVEGDRAFLPKIGWVAFRRGKEGTKRYRALGGKPKRVTVKRKASGWYISFCYAWTVETPEPVALTPDNSVGLDLGSIDLITTSTGEKLANPRVYRRAEKKLRRAQKALARKQRGSKRYGKQKHRVARLHERVANTRHDTLHKLSCRLIRENQAVMVENLNVKGIAKRMGKSAHDAGWAELVRQLEYKAAWTGSRNEFRTVVKVDRFFPSSKLCSVCGYRHSDLTLAQRQWQCPACGVEHDRDVNAAVNLLHEGLRVATSLRPVAAGHAETQNARGQRVRPSRRAALGETRISRL